jgi:hypothetical protein
MVASMLGLLISLIYVWKLSPSWGFAFSIVFSVMLASSIISMTHADPDSFIELETKKKKQKYNIRKVKISRKKSFL